MAIVKGTNAGFVTAAPSGDPGGINYQMDYYVWAIRDTSPATAVKITEVGWYCDNATEEAKFEVGLYDDDGANAPDNLLHSDTTNAKGTDAGWKRVTGLDWVIIGSTIYWIAVQLDNTATTTNSVYSSLEYEHGDASQSTLLDPWGTSSHSGAYYHAFYAVWEAAGGISIPVAMHHYTKNIGVK